MKTKGSRVYFSRNLINKFCDENNISISAIENKIGRSRGFVRNASKLGYMSGTAYEHLINILGVPYDTFLQSTEDGMNAEHEQHQTEPQTGYGINLKYTPTTVRLAITLNGGEVVKAWAKIVDDSELGFIKSISYAAHLCYKFAEQNQFQNSIEEQKTLQEG